MDCHFFVSRGFKDSEASNTRPHPISWIFLATPLTSPLLWERLSAALGGRLDCQQLPIHEFTYIKLCSSTSVGSGRHSGTKHLWSDAISESEFQTMTWSALLKCRNTLPWNGQPSTSQRFQKNPAWSSWPNIIDLRVALCSPCMSRYINRLHCWSMWRPRL